MGIPYNLNGDDSEEKIQRLISELGPRYGCRGYVIKNGGKAELVARSEFDDFYSKEQFSDGPFRESFGDGYGEPYNPYRQAWGKLKDGEEIIYCELSQLKQVKLEELLGLLENDSLKK